MIRRVPHSSETNLNQLQFGVVAAMTVPQPRANDIAGGRSSIEIRHWSTDYRGPLIIASARAPATGSGPFGCAVAIAELTDCRPYRNTDEDHLASGGVPWNPAHTAFVLNRVRRLTKPQPIDDGDHLYLVEMPATMLAFLEGDSSADHGEPAPA
ncbi:MAG: hypothetical protein VYC34_03215 [Planctomycetota bacterium]|nr:hypothetical protein [Planctomycetota bacterium]